MIAANTVVGGRYRVIRHLGGGGMKQVYLAEDLRLAARPCALAEMVDSLPNAEAQRQAEAAFSREADMLAELDHPHIPIIFDRFSEQNRHYLVMELVDGKTLEERLKECGGKIDVEEMADIALQILDTLEYLHQRNPPVIYRDLKPSNIMITSTGLVKLIDFGIARHFQPQSSATMIGTQGYAPPEQYRGKVETRSDLYALGATLHHALSGRDPTTEPPFSFPPLRSLRPELSPALAELVGAALSYDVEHRIANTGEFRHRLLAARKASATPALGTASRPQLQLPLNNPAPPPSQGSPASPSTATGPTLLVNAMPESPCPTCGRLIPADSRFCSYCAADLRRVLGPGQVVSDPQGETVQLPSTGTGGGRWRRGPHQPGVDKRRSRVLTLVMLVVLGFALFRLLAYWLTTPVGVGAAPHSEYANSSDQSFATAELRTLLNEEGYGSVSFELHGDTITLSGTVASDTDREIVETTAFMVTHASEMEDHIQVTD
jgi:serine/threonine protein kinase